MGWTGNADADQQHPQAEHKCSIANQHRKVTEFQRIARDMGLMKVIINCASLKQDVTNTEAMKMIWQESGFEREPIFHWSRSNIESINRLIVVETHEFDIYSVDDLMY